MTCAYRAAGTLALASLLFAVVACSDAGDDSGMDAAPSDDAGPGGRTAAGSGGRAASTGGSGGKGGGAGGTGGTAAPAIDAGDSDAAHALDASAEADADADAGSTQVTPGWKLVAVDTARRTYLDYVEVPASSARGRRMRMNCLRSRAGRSKPSTRRSVSRSLRLATCSRRNRSSRCYPHSRRLPRRSRSPIRRTRRAAAPADASNAIQAALDAAQMASEGHPVDVLVPPGTFDHSKELTVAALLARESSYQTYGVFDITVRHNTIAHANLGGSHDGLLAYGDDPGGSHSSTTFGKMSAIRCGASAFATTRFFPPFFFFFSPPPPPPPPPPPKKKKKIVVNGANFTTSDNQVMPVSCKICESARSTEPT